MDASDEGVGGGDSWGEHRVCRPDGLQNGMSRQRKEGTKNKEEPKGQAVHLGLQDGGLFVSVPHYGGCVHFLARGTRGSVRR